MKYIFLSLLLSSIVLANDFVAAKESHKQTLEAIQQNNSAEKQAIISEINSYINLKANEGYFETEFDTDITHLVTEEFIETVAKELRKDGYEVTTTYTVDPIISKKYVDLVIKW